MKLGIFPKWQNFWMSGTCLNNYCIGNAIIEDMDKLGNIVWDYELFFHGSGIYVGGSPMVAG